MATCISIKANGTLETAPTEIYPACSSGLAVFGVAEMQTIQSATQSGTMVVTLPPIEAGEMGEVFGIFFVMTLLTYLFAWGASRPYHFIRKLTER